MSGNEETNGSNGSTTGNGNGDGGVIEGAKPDTDKKEGTPAVPAKPEANPKAKGDKDQNDVKEAKNAKTTAKGKKDGKAVKAVKANKQPKTIGGKDGKKGQKGKAGKAEKPAAKLTKNGKNWKDGKGSKGGKPIDARTEVTDGCPYRPTSSYGKLWTLLHKNREKGISRADFIKQGAKIVGKDEKHTAYDVAVVASPTKDGTAHPSANRAADHYWVERTEGGFLKLHMRK